MFRALCWGCVAALLLGLGIGCDGGSANLSTPKAAATTFIQALQRGDASAAKAAAVSDPASDKAIEGMAVVMSAVSRLRAAAEARFGKDQAGMFSEMDMSTMMTDIESAQETITGDTATLKPSNSADGMRLKRVGGQWKVDLSGEDISSGFSDGEARQVGQAMNELADEIRAGKYKTAQEAQMALGMKMMTMGGDR